VLALVATLAALAALGRLAFAPLPNIKPTTDIVLISGYVLGGAPGFAVGTLAALVSNFFFGQGPYTPFQMIGWGAIGVLGALLPRELGRYGLALACGAAGLIYGIWMDFHLWLLYTGHSLGEFGLLAARGAPFNAAHVVGNVAFCVAFGPALVAALRRFRRRSEIVWHPAPMVGAAMLGAIVLAAPLAIAAGGRDAVARGADYLESARTADGGFGASRGDARADPIFTGWAAIGLAASGRSPGASTAAYLSEQARKVTDVGDIERTMLALHAAGRDTTELGRRLARKRARNGSYEALVNRSAFGILALKTAGRRADPKTVAWLLRAQNRNGGWGLTRGGPSDVDDTAAVVQALVVAGRRETAPVRRAVRWLVRQRNADGGYPLQPRTPSNAQSTAFAVQALVAARSRAADRSIAYLRSLQGEDGSVRYDRSNDQTPTWVTAQAIAAIARKPLPVAPAKGMLVQARQAGTLAGMLFSPVVG
jgi:energy-coupling factor transport system substrate-specific component